MIVNFKFKPTKDFHSDEFQSEYIEGLVYTVHDGNDKLRDASTKWAEDGLVELLSAEGAPIPEAKMAGQGIVK